MKATIAYVTGRAKPKLEWLIDDLGRQAQPGDELELVFVDFYGRGVQAFATLPREPWLVNVIEASPKPTIWQGPHRVAMRDYWAMSNARNTALVHCETDYVAFLDDRCRLDTGWLAAVRRGERERKSVLVGPYDKREASGISVDHRSHQARIGAVKPYDVGGRWLFGGNFALPLAWALDVNGFEEGCDSVGGEDYIFGQMLENLGRRIEFDASMHVLQDRVGIDHPFPRWDKGISPDDKSHAMNRRFGKRTRTEFTPDLSALRELVRAGGTFPIPDPNGDHRDWYDGQPIKEM